MSSILFSMSPTLSLAQVEHPEVRRVRGFEQYKKQRKLVDREREKGLTLHLEKLEMEKREYDRALAEYRKEKRKEKPLEETLAFKQRIEERREEKRDAEIDREEFRQFKRVEQKQIAQAKLNKMEELGLPEDRARFDLKKRALYGAPSSFGKGPKASTGSAAPYSPPASSGSDYYPTPPPPSFDEFPPPPSFGDDSFDLPPPPPPPLPYDDGTGFNSAPFDEFPPPPPPPIDDF